MSAGGYVKLWRSIEDWEWYNDIPCRLLFMHCLVKVNRLPGTFQGEPIAPGEWPTSLPKMALGAGISEQQVRTAINKLRSTGDIRDRSTGSFRVVTICNWEHWQGSTSEDQQASNSQTAGESTANQQRNNRRIYPIEEGKNTKKGRREEGKNNPEPVALIWPPWATDDFGNAWERWKAYKAERREKYKPIGEQAAVSKLAKEFTNEADAIAAINYSMGQGWKGIFPQRQQNGNGNGKPGSYDQRRAALVELFAQEQGHPNGPTGYEHE